MAYIIREGQFHGKLTLERYDELRRLGLKGDISPEFRPWYWRIVLGILSDKGLNGWVSEMSSQVSEYFELKKNSLPNINNVQSDPLFVMSNNSESDWHKYYQDLEEAKFIRGDLERLYMAGIDEQYFQTKARQDILLHVVFVWSCQHKLTGYRQGMHEIAAPILFVMQEELDKWKANLSTDRSLSTHPLSKVITDANLEAHTYWVFERIMRQLEPLYYPSPMGEAGVTFIVQYCTQIQDDLLLKSDAQLCNHLKECGVHAQLYGMRWARLLLGRELPLQSNMSLRVWDTLFASCAQFSAPTSLPMDVAMILQYPLLQSLQDVMVAMILNMF